MSDHADLIAEAREALIAGAYEGQLVDRLADALESQPAPMCKNVRNGVCLICGDGVLNNGEHIDPERHAAALVADSREALARPLRAEWERRVSERVVGNVEAHIQGLVDALLASGVVSLAADRDRAVEVKVLRMAAQSVEDTARQGGGLQTAAAAIHREADSIEGGASA